MNQKDTTYYWGNEELNAVKSIHGKKVAKQRKTY